MDRKKIPKQSGEITRGEKGEVSRRDFLIGAGAVVVGGAVGAGITYPLVAGKEVPEKTTTVEVTKTVEVPGPTVTTTVGAETVTTTTTVGAETVTSTVPGPTKTVTTTLADGVVEPAFEPEETVVKVLSEHGELSEVDVKNGRIVRVRPVHLDEKYPREKIGSWKIEARGKTFEPPMKSWPGYLASSYKKRAYSPNRVRYPLKRVDWEPGGVNVNPQNRGKSKFKRVSWDEATTIIANEIRRIQEKYGLYGVMLMGDGHGECKNLPRKHGAHKELLDKMGGYTDTIRNADSWEGWYWGSMHVWGSVGTRVGCLLGSGLKSISENTDMIVYQGCDLETTPNGMRGQGPSRIHYWFDELGIKAVYVCPDLNYAAAVHADKWIPVLPNTDMALQLAIIYTWIDEDIYDKDYVETHTVGFDKFKAYVIGDEDGVPKTPAWASPRCGVPVWTIKAFAREWAAKRTCTAHHCGGSFIRNPYSHEPARLECIQLGMQGLGKPGVYQISAFGTMSMPRTEPSPRLGPVKVPKEATIKQFMSKTLVHHAVLEGHTVQWGTTSAGAPVENQFVKYEYPIPAAEGGTEVHMMWIDNPCWTVCWNDGYKFIEAFRSPKIECIVAEHQWLEDDCLFADIVLPVSTKFELDDIISAMSESFLSVSLERQAIKPIGESMSDYDMCCEIARKLGADVYDKYTGGKTIEEWLKSSYEESNIKDLISWEELNEKQYYVPPIAPDWEKDPNQLEGFYEDPDNNPLGSPSGKLEFYSERLAENFPDDEERGPYPKWVIGGPASEGWTHDESLWGERCKSYPLLLITNHPRWGEHAQHDDIPWLRELPTCKVKGPDGYMYEPIWIHPTTAAERGIESGDIVKMYNERGAVLGGAYVCERIIPGAVYQDHGKRIDLITDGVDRGGSNNLISPEMGVSKNCWGMATSGFLVEVEKVSGNQMEEWRKKYPEAFERGLNPAHYEPAYGLKFGAWVEGGM